jgi:BlaI family transcriptional regulator, penicillinase repressor
MKQLTRAEEEIMQILWQLRKGFVRDILERLPEPKPAYTTVSTVVRVLEKKGFVAYTQYGNTYEYYPLVDKNSYSKQQFRHFLEDYFGGSFEKLLSFFANEKEVDIRELEKMKALIETKLNEKDDGPAN